MTKIEEGKYYVDGEGFYKCVGKEENAFNKYVLMDALIIKNSSLSFYQGITYVEEPCEKRMVECSEEDYNFVLGQTISVYQKLDVYNTQVFKHLWTNKDKAQ